MRFLRFARGTWQVTVSNVSKQQWWEISWFPLPSSSFIPWFSFPLFLCFYPPLQFLFIPPSLYLPPSLFLTACPYLFLSTSFLPSYLLLSIFCLHTYFMFLLPRLPFFLPSCISLFPRCSLINSVYCAVRLFFLTLFLLFQSPPDGDALALL